MYDNASRCLFFESEHGSELLSQLQGDREEEQGTSAASKLLVFARNLERQMYQDPGIRKGHCQALRIAGYKENVDDMTDIEFAKFLGREGLEYLIDRYEAAHRQLQAR